MRVLTHHLYVEGVVASDSVGLSFPNHKLNLIGRGYQVTETVKKYLTKKKRFPDN